MIRYNYYVEHTAMQFIYTKNHSDIMTSFPAGIDLKEIGWTWWHKISKQAKGC